MPTAPAVMRSRFKWHTRATWSARRQDPVVGLARFDLVRDDCRIRRGHAAISPRVSAARCCGRCSCRRLHHLAAASHCTDLGASERSRGAAPETGMVHGGLGRSYGCPRTVDGNLCEAALSKLRASYGGCLAHFPMSRRSLSDRRLIDLVVNLGNLTLRYLAICRRAR